MQPGNTQALILRLCVLILSQVRLATHRWGHRVTVPTVTLIYIHLSSIIHAGRFLFIFIRDSDLH